MTPATQCRVAVCGQVLAAVEFYHEIDLLIYRTECACDPTFLENSRRCFDTLPPIWWRWLLARRLDGGNTFVVASDSSRQNEEGQRIGGRVIYSAWCLGYTSHQLTFTYPRLHLVTRILFSMLSLSRHCIPQRRPVWEFWCKE